MKKLSINLIIIGLLSLLISVLSLTILNEQLSKNQMIVHGFIGFGGICLTAIGVVCSIGSISPNIYRFTHRMSIADNSNQYTRLGKMLNQKDITQLKEISGKTVHEIFRTCPVIVASSRNQKVIGMWMNYKDGFVYATNRKEAEEILSMHGFSDNDTPMLTIADPK